MVDEVFPLHGQADSWSEVFRGFDDFDGYKKIELAVQLDALLNHSKKTRAEVAELMGVARGHITRLLSGDANPTAKTIYDFCAALGYAFDIHFRLPFEPAYPQPWEGEEKYFQLPDRENEPISMRLQLQTREQVRQDIADELGSNFYISMLVVEMPQEKRMGLVDEVLNYSNGYPVHVGLSGLNTDQENIYVDKESALCHG